jgi:hypothetical protein
MFGELFDVLLAQKKIRDARFPECQHVLFFHHNGEPFNKDFRTAWEKALTKVRLAGRLFQDLRRTAVRNLVRAGVPEVVAMRISGHKKRAVFDRYNITSEDDIRFACERLSIMHQPRLSHGHRMGTIWAHARLSGGLRDDRTEKIFNKMNGAREGTRTPTVRTTGS